MRLSASTGKARRVLTSPWVVPGGNADYSCGVLWTDAPGRRFLLACGLTSGRADNGKVTRMYLQLTPDIPSSWAVYAW